MPAVALVAAVLAGTACGPPVQRQLDAWHARRDQQTAAVASAGTDRYLLPTDRLGVWLDLRRRADGEVTLARVDPRRTAVMTWDDTCRATLRERPTDLGWTAGAGSLTDADLSALVAAHARVAVYVWSPHMPLSVDGVQQASRAAAATGFLLVPLLDPRADAGYAAQVAREAGLPPASLRSFHSVELLFRQAMLHAPTLLAFVRGDAAGDAVPGYRDADAYTFELRRLLQPAATGREPPP